MTLLFNELIGKANFDNKVLCQLEEAISGYSTSTFNDANLSVKSVILPDKAGEIESDQVDIRVVEAAIILIEYLKGEVEKAHRLVFEKDSRFILDSKHRNIYDQLPERFKREEGIVVAQANGMPLRTFQRFLSKKDLFERIEHGHYTKIIKNSDE